MIRQAAQAILVHRFIATLVHKGLKLGHGDRVARHVVTRQREGVLRSFIPIGQRLALPAPHPEWPGRDLYKAQQRFIWQKADILSEARIAEASQGASSRSALHGTEATGA